MVTYGVMHLNFSNGFRHNGMFGIIMGMETGLSLLSPDQRIMSVSTSPDNDS